MARTTIADLLVEARSRIEPRLDPASARAACERGALIVDLRSRDERSRNGVIPGSIHIPRSVLEWRLDPDSDWTNPHVGGLERELVLVCADGYSSSLAAASLRTLGFGRATDMVGGFTAWREAGLPVIPAPGAEPRPGELSGMGPPDSGEPPAA